MIATALMVIAVVLWFYLQGLAADDRMTSGAGANMQKVEPELVNTRNEQHEHAVRVFPSNIDGPHNL